MGITPRKLSRHCAAFGRTKMSKKNKKAIWIADEYALDVEMNRALLDMLWAKPKLKKQKRKDVVAFYMNAYAEEKAKADAKLAELFAYAPDPERPVQFEMPRALEKAPCMGAGKAEVIQEVIARVGNPQMGWGKTATIPLVKPTNKYFCVQETAPWGNGDNVAEFEKMADGGFHVAATNRNGEEFADINMTAEQFAAFKQWVMEN